MVKLTLQGKYNHATVFTENIEETAIGQIIGMLFDYHLLSSLIPNRTLHQGNFRHFSNVFKVLTTYFIQLHYH